MKFNFNKVGKSALASIMTLIACFAVFIMFSDKQEAKADINPMLNFTGKVTDSNSVAVDDNVYNFSFGLYTTATSGTAFWSEDLTAANMFSAAISGVSIGASSTTYTYASDSNESTLRVGQYLTNASTTEYELITDYDTTANTVTVATITAWTAGEGINNRPRTEGGVVDIDLGSVSDLSSENFNQTLYLQVTFNGEVMQPRKLITAVAQAFNADKLDGYDSSDFANIADDVTITGEWDFANVVDIATSSAITTLTVTQSGTGDIINLFGGTTEVFTITENGYVGIGTTTPTVLLTIGSSTPGSIAATSSYRSVFIAGDLEVDGTIYGGVQGTITPGGFIQGSVVFISATGDLEQDNTNFFWDDSNNLLGLGTSSPEMLLTVGSSTPSYIPTADRYRSAYISGLLEVGGTGTSTIADNFDIKGDLNVGSSFYVNSSGIVTAGTWQGDTVAIAYGGTGTSTFEANSLVYASGDDDIGEILIGTAGYVLAVYNGVPTWVATSTIGVQGIGAGTADYVARWTDANTIGTGVLYDNATNVGIGTSSPQSLLTVYKSTDDALISFGDQNSNTAHWYIGTDYSDSSKFKIASSSLLSLAEFTFTKDGYLGIGTTSPTQQLSLSNLLYVGGTGTSTFENNLEVLGALQVGNSSLYLDSDSIENLSGNLILQPSSGSVGIGTTSPATTLSVAGSGYFTGGLGVGMLNTTAGTLHVSGQCVTGDTILRRRRRRKRKDGSWEDVWEDVEIKDIQPGDEILTLDEKTGKLVVSRVRALMDMGVKPIWKITTASGKQIRTTGNHPYLTKPEAIRVGKLEVDQSVRIEELNRDTILGIAGSGVEFNYIIPRKVKRQFYEAFRAHGLQKRFAPVLFAGAIAAMLEKAQIKTSDLVIDIEYPGYEALIKGMINMVFPDTDINYNSIGKKSPAHKAAYLTHIGKLDAQDALLSDELAYVLAGIYKTQENPIKDLIRLSCDRRTVTPRVYEDSQSNKRSTILSIDQYKKLVKRGLWKKVIELKVGQEIAITDGVPAAGLLRRSFRSAPFAPRNDNAVWDKITKIELMPAEQVYDIEVEGTHNFIGNGIVAHNTYLGGNVGIGTTTPDSTLPLRILL